MSTNATCFTKTASEQSPPLFQNGNIVFQAHYVGWIVAGFFTIVASVTSFWLVNKHLQWYTNKREQRYIVRILFMVPIYAVVSLASYLFWDQATPILLVRDGYESTVLTSFFYLLLMYISPNADEQKDVFRKAGFSRQNDREARRGDPVKKWVFPLGFIKAKPEDGLYFLQMMKWGVLQYCVIRPTTTLIAVILNYVGLYCDSSWSPGWGYVYITVIVSISVSIAMYCLIQLYVPVAGHLAPHKPMLKLFAVKAVVFLTFWQATFLSVLSMFNIVKDTKYMTAEEINIGIAALLETFEMMVFAFIHIKAFSYKPYRPPYHAALTSSPPPQRTPRLKALRHVMDFRETFREVWAGCVYMYRMWKGQETDTAARRLAIMEDALGRSRIRANMEKTRKNDLNAKTPDVDGVKVEVEREVVVGAERQWLGTGDDYGYGLGYTTRRERSAELVDQFDMELEKRGYPRQDPAVTQHRVHEVEPDHPRQRSWWRGLYERVSHTGYDDGDEQRLTPAPKRNSRSHVRRHSRRADGDIEPRSILYDDLPPPSAIRTYMDAGGSRDPSITPPHLTSSKVVPLENSLLPTEAHNTPSLLHVDNARDLRRSDSVLGRVFPHQADTDLSSADGRTVTNATSSQSHATQIRLSPSPFLIPQESIAARTATFVTQGWDSDPFTPQATTTNVDSNTSSPSSPLTEAGPRLMTSRSSNVKRSSTSGRNLEFPPSKHDTRPLPSPSKASPRSPSNRPQIVLPTPLSPTVVSRNNPPRDARTHRTQEIRPSERQIVGSSTSDTQNSSLRQISLTNATKPRSTVGGSGNGLRRQYPRSTDRRSSEPSTASDDTRKQSSGVPRQFTAVPNSPSIDFTPTDFTRPTHALRHQSRTTQSSRRLSHSHTSHLMNSPTKTETRVPNVPPI